MAISLKEENSLKKNYVLDTNILIHNPLNNTYRTAPIFDSGYSLLVGNEPYKHTGEISNRLESVTVKPFSSNFEMQANCFTIFMLSYQIALPLCKSVLQVQLEKYKSVYDIKELDETENYDKIL